MSVLIIGASVAGIRTAQALRAAGYDGGVTIVGEESHHPYDKPPISKEMLLPDSDGAPVPLLSAAELADLRVELHLGTRATGLDPVARTVAVEDGRSLGYTELVIATGATARTLPRFAGLAGVHTLRNAEDAVALRAQLRHAQHAVVVGAGFIGAEFASSARAHGVDVTVVEMLPQPFSVVLGPEVGALLGELHTRHGATVLTGTGVDHLTGTDRVTGVVLTDGRILPADVVVVGIGAVPATGWLAGSGLPVDDGIRCDERLRVLGVEHVHAAGDVAHWQHGFYGSGTRIEHWTNANEHAAIVAADLCGTAMPRPQVPYVWSDQYGHRIQIVGRPHAGEPVLVRGGSGEPVLAVYADAAGTVVGAVVVDAPRLFMKLRKAVTNRVLFDALDIDGRVASRT